MAKTDLLTKDEVASWLERIKLSEKWRDPEEKKWKRFVNYARGKFYDTATSDDQIAINLVHPHVRIIIPAIYSKNPDIIVQPRSPKASNSARVMEQLLRYLIKELNLKGEMKRILLDAILVGHGWIKTGYQTEFGSSAKKGMIAKVFESLNKLMSGEEVKEESTYSEEPDERIVSEKPWIRRVSPFDMFVPALSIDRFELPWIAQRFVRRVVDVKKNPNYQNNKTVNPSGNAREVLKEKSALNNAFSLTEDLEEYVTMYEIWDCTEDRIYIIGEDNENCFQTKDNAYTFLDSRHTFEMLGFNFITDQFYPLSEIEPWEPQLHELNDIRSQMSKHRRKMNRRYIFTEGELSPSAIELLKSGEDGAVIPTSSEDARTAVAPVMDAPLSNDVYQAELRVKEDITNIGGITDYQRGNASAGAKTATEASIVESQSRFRSEERLDTVGDFASRVIRNLAMISMKFMDKKAVRPILGGDADLWVEGLDDEAIRCEHIFDVIYGSTAAINRDVDKQQYLQLYGLIANDPYINPVKAREELLRKFDHRNIEEWFRPEFIAMLEQAQMQAILDAMELGGKGTAGTGSSGASPTPSPSVPSGDAMMGGIRQALNVTTPGGVGGGNMAEGPRL